MDGTQFDALARFVGVPTTRRLAVRSFTGGTLGAALALLGLAPGPEETAAHDTRKKCRKLKGRKKKACLKKARKHAARHAGENQPPPPPPPGGDQAPPCTAAACPLPPACSQAALENCTAALVAQWVTEAEPCRDACQDPEAAACRACLAPIVEAWAPEAETCVAQACGLPLAASRTTHPPTRGGRTHAVARAGDEVTAQSWWTRNCQKPCCYLDYAECKEEARDDWGKCMLGAAAGCVFSGPICLGAMLGCMSILAYDDAACQEIKGCPDGGSCREGDICCRDSFDQLCNGRCCHVPPGGRLSDVCCNGPAGLTCCTNGASCCNGHCLGDQAGPWAPCGTTCCDPNHTCCSGQCRAKTQGPWTECPIPSWPDRCCDGTDVCCNGSCRATADGPWTMCGDTCCDPNHECCNGDCRSNVRGPWTPCGDHCCERGTYCDANNECHLP